MKKFHFNLEALHKYRGSLEDISMREFSEGLKRFRESENGVLRLREERGRLSREMDRIKVSGDTRLELALYDTYIRDLKEHIEVKKAELKALKKELECKRLALIEVIKDRKVLDVMKEKSLRAHNLQSTRAEQKVLDDIAGTFFSIGGGNNEK